MISLQSSDKRLIRLYLMVGLVLSVFYAGAEYLIRFSTEDPQAFWPLILRSMIAAVLITLSVAFFEILVRNKLVQKSFLYLVLVKTICYTAIISWWLTIVNGIWQIIISDATFFQGMVNYLADPTYPINLFSVFVAIVVILSLLQINTLHRKGELLKFITGRYNQPVEIERIFAFVDLKGSTGIAEQLGHLQFGSFLKDYYSDITNAIRTTKAEIYQ